MPQTPIWKQTAADRTAVFDAVFATIQPAERTGPTTKTQLRPIHAQIVAKRSEGYSIEQICEAMKDPRIGIEVSPSYVRKLLRTVALKREKRRKARLAAIVAAAERKSSVATAPTKLVGPFGNLPGTRP